MIDISVKGDMALIAPGLHCGYDWFLVGGECVQSHARILKVLS